MHLSISRPQLRQLKTQLPDFYIAARLAPVDLQQSWIAALLFHAELERIATRVSEPMMGAIRYAWWHEQLKDYERNKTPIPHDLFPAMREALDKSANMEPWHNLIEAHAARLNEEEDTHPTQKLFELWQHLANETFYFDIRTASDWDHVIENLQSGIIHHKIQNRGDGVMITGTVDAIIARILKHYSSALHILPVGKTFNPEWTRLMLKLTLLINPI